ncbi:MAG: hypothetical protein VB824_03540 [Dehalococcoidia bacterium]
MSQLRKAAGGVSPTTGFVSMGINSVSPGRVQAGSSATVINPASVQVQDIMEAS